jgi:hypothetical protein
LFVTLGNDATIKVWDSGNVLLREIQFDEQPSALCIASSWADLLVSWENRIELIRYSDYLPPGYAQSISSAFHKSHAAEEPLPLETNQELIRLIPRGLLPLRAEQNLDRLDITPEGSCIKETSEKPLPEEDLDIPRRPTRHSVYGSVAPANRRRFVSVLHRVGEAPPTVAHIAVAEGDAVIDVRHPELPRSTSILEVPQLDLTHAPKKDLLPLVKDGVIPNSTALHYVIDSEPIKINLRKKKKLVLENAENQARRSEEYKARLNRLLAMIPRKPTQVAPSLEKPKSAQEPVKPAFHLNRSKVKVPMAGEKRGPPPATNLSVHALQGSGGSSIAELEEAEPEADEPPDDIPRLIQKALDFHVFQEQQVFVMKEGKNGKIQRKLAVQATPDGLLPQLLSSFENGDMLLKTEIAQFINWMHDEYEFTNARRILEIYLDVLFSKFLHPINDLEKDLIFTLLSSVNGFGSGDTDAYLCLFLYTIYGDDRIESLAKSVLATIGIGPECFPWLSKRISDIFNLAKRDAKENGSVVQLARKYLLAWIRRIPKFIGAATVDVSEKAGAKGKKKKKSKKKSSMLGTCLCYLNFKMILLSLNHVPVYLTCPCLMFLKKN